MVLLGGDQQLAKQINFAVACVERDAEKDVQGARRLQERIYRVDCLIQMNSALTSEGVTFSTIRPYLVTVTDLKLEVPEAQCVQVWALYLVEHLSSMIGKEACDAQLQQDIVQAFLPAAPNQPAYSFRQGSVVMSSPICFNLLKPRLIDLPAPFEKKLKMAADVLIHDIYKAMFNKGSQLKEVIFDFTGAVAAAYKGFLVKLGDAEERPSLLTDTIKVCRAVMTAIKPATCQDFDYVVQVQADFKLRKTSLLAHLHVYIFGAKDKLIESLFSDIVLNAISYKEAYATLKSDEEVVLDMPSKEDTRLEDCKDLFECLNRVEHLRNHVRSADGVLYECKLRSAVVKVGETFQDRVRANTCVFEDCRPVLDAISLSLRLWSDDEGVTALQKWTSEQVHATAQLSAYAKLAAVLATCSADGKMDDGQMQRINEATIDCAPGKGSAETMTAIKVVLSALETDFCLDSSFQDKFLTYEKLVGLLCGFPASFAQKARMWSLASKLLSSLSEFDKLGDSVGSRIQADVRGVGLSALIRDSEGLKLEANKVYTAPSSSAEALSHYPQQLQTILLQSSLVVKAATDASVGKQRTDLAEIVDKVSPWARGGDDGKDWSVSIKKTQKLNAVIKIAHATLLRHSADEYDGAKKSLSTCISKYAETCKQLHMAPDSDLSKKAAEILEIIELKYAEWLLVALIGSTREAGEKRKKMRAIRKLIVDIPEGWDVKILEQLRAAGEDILASVE
jgi:hypothetical protein